MASPRSYQPYDSRLSGPKAPGRPFSPTPPLSAVPAGRFFDLLAFGKFFVGSLEARHVTSAAAALSYSTTLAVVPALALVLTSLAAFPAFDPLRARIQRLIVDNLVPDTGLEISQALETFVSAAGKLTAFGIVGLVLTAILLLLTVEGQLNLVFGNPRTRPLVSRVLVLWAVMTIGPLLLAVGFSLFGTFSTLPFITKADTAAGLTILLGHILPTVITWTLLSFVFVVVPHHRIRWRDAMIGAAFAAVLLAVLRYTFVFYVVMMTSYKAIYGALAAVPVFLAWIYFVWLIVMAGAVISATLPEWRSAQAQRNRGTAGRVLLALEIMAQLARARSLGRGATVTQIAEGAGQPPTDVAEGLEKLRLGRFVAISDENAWLLSRDLEHTPLADLLHHFGLGLDGPALRLPAISALAQRLDAVLQRAAESEQHLLSVSLARVVTPANEPDAKAEL